MRNLSAFALAAVLAACGSDSAAFTPTETTSSGGEGPAAAAPASSQSAAAQPTTSIPEGSAGTRAAEAAPAVGSAATEEAPQSSTGDAKPVAEAKPSAQPAAPTPKQPADPTKATPKQAAAGTPAPKSGVAAPQPAATTQQPAAAPVTAQPAAAPAAQPAAPNVAHVIVELRGLKSDSGKIQAALFRSANGFPEDPSKATVRKLAKISGKKVDLSFDIDPPGTFVVLVHHDENGDNKMQRGMLGQPAEGWGATRDPAANFGPPSFNDAKLTIAAGETKRVVIKMRY